MIRFDEINKDNFYEVLKLEVNESQKNFVSSNVKSLAECYLYRHNNDVFPYAIVIDEIIVGFILIDLDIEEKEFLIWRMMIDKKYQNKGYGKKVILKTIEKAKKMAQFENVTADYVEGNTQMEHLLKTLGFIEVDKDEDNHEIIMSYPLND
ncbi:putative histone acetyltransferase HPA2 [Alteracholeplasma palmae J233]|uniref:Putative histone acetyltransferase HPA2 n=1 Tax=Alteracholeplasma palmae (strain ATCC 49389 / J233) TaxID=1318466 RepID=U4KQB4_ALTPJ|nr:GNAT family N-acetyltransferase [Alteracholeplasma palmae]CCV64480.1 putative histone acetyltransferase HPA2 [Alteracholeplasma palmae J233]